MIHVNFELYNKMALTSLTGVGVESSIIYSEMVRNSNASYMKDNCLQYSLKLLKLKKKLTLG